MLRPLAFGSRASILVLLGALGCGSVSGDAGTVAPPADPSPAATPVPAEPAASPVPASPAVPLVPASPGAGVAAEPPKPVLPPPNEECKALAEKIALLDQGIPFSFLDLKRSVDEINEDVIQTTTLSREFLAKCDGSEPAPAVRSALARMLFVRNQRAREELQGEELSAEEVTAKMNAYYAEILALASRASAESSLGSRARLVADWMSVELNLRLGKPADARKLGLAVLTGDIPKEIRSSVTSIVAQSYFVEGLYCDAVPFLREIAAKYSDSPEYVTYNIRLFDALTGCGDLKGMEELMELVRVEYGERMESTPPGVLRLQYQQWYYLSPFWIGFVRMALGDTEGARKGFEQFVAEVDSLEAKALSEGKKIDNVLLIYRDFRAKHLLAFLADYLGKPPAHDFEFDDMWATSAKASLKESKGKVVAAVMRRPGDTRAASFLQAIDRLVKTRSGEGLVGVNCYFLSGKPNPEADAVSIQSMIDDLTQLGVSLPSGYDPDREGQKTFQGLYGTLGTASFALINRKGELAWWLADPRDMDRKLAEAVILRLLAEK